MLVYWHVYACAGPGPGGNFWHFPLQHLNGAKGDGLQSCPWRTQQRFEPAKHFPFFKTTPNNFICPQHFEEPQHWSLFLHDWPMGEQGEHCLSLQTSLLPQSELVQHSRHLLNTKKPQQFPDAQSEPCLQDFPFESGAIHVPFLWKMFS